MSMLECFFSNEYAGRGNLFERFFIWKDEKYRQLQGTYPVIFLSFAGVKTENAESMKLAVKQIITKVYGRYRNIMKSDLFDENDRKDFASVNKDMDDVTAHTALNSLCIYLKKFYGKDVIIPHVSLDKIRKSIGRRIWLRYDIRYLSVIRIL